MSDIARDIVEEYDALVKKYKELEKSNFQYIKALERIKQLEDRLNKIQMKVDEQAEDEGLWFNHKYITEGYLQRSLRELHKVVEGK